jgi:hypothetical protein
MDGFRFVACQIADYRDQQSGLERKIQDLQASCLLVNDEGDVVSYADFLDLYK